MASEFANWTCSVCFEVVSEEGFACGHDHRTCLACTEQWMLSCLDCMKSSELVFACPGTTHTGAKCTSTLPTEPSGHRLRRCKPNSIVFPKAEAYLAKKRELAHAQNEKQRTHDQLHAAVTASDAEAIRSRAKTMLLDNEVMRCTFCACPFDSYTGCNAVKCQGNNDSGCGNCFCGICGISLNETAASPASPSADRLAHLHAARFHSSSGDSYFLAKDAWKELAAKLLRTQQLAEAVLRTPLELHHHLVIACIAVASENKQNLWDFSCLAQLVMLRLMRSGANSPAPALKYFFGQAPDEANLPNDSAEWFARTTYQNYRGAFSPHQPPPAAAQAPPNNAAQALEPVVEYFNALPMYPFQPPANPFQHANPLQQQAELDPHLAQHHFHVNLKLEHQNGEVRFFWRA